MMPPPADQVAHLCRGCQSVFNSDELLAKLDEGRPLNVKLGVDPTAPDIHLGHCVVLDKLRDFQDLGHQAILIIGDFTAMIGDPSGRSVTRPQLTHEQVLENARSYQEQAFKILKRQRSKIVFNGEWFSNMSFQDVIRLNSRVTLQQMLVREDFRDRLDRGQAIRAHEIQYPIMQAWDSVMIKADVELGGTDQLFNIMVGRDLQHEEWLDRSLWSCRSSRASMASRR
jgi:tyrosyl-tRNA synthetase